MNINELPYVLRLLWKIFPAYVANASPLIFVKKGHPIDLNKNFIDKKPILGKGKTIEGFMVGTIIGTITGLIQGQGSTALTLSIGAMLGDLSGSFIKRRLNISRGSPAPIIDQSMLLLGAVLLTNLFFTEIFDLTDLFVLILITIPIHFITNVVAYLLKIKNVPW